MPNKNKNKNKNTDDTQMKMEQAVKSPNNQNKDNKNESEELPPLTFGQIMLGLSPLWFIIALIIFAAIVASIANYPDDKEYEPGPYGDWPNWGGI